MPVTVTKHRLAFHTVEGLRAVYVCVCVGKMVACSPEVS